MLVDWRRQRRSLEKYFDAAAETNYLPSGKRQKVVLWLHNDPRSIPVLRKSGLKYFFLDYDRLARQGTVDIRIENGLTQAMLKMGQARLNFEDVFAVIWNPPLWMVFNQAAKPAAGRGLSPALRIRRWSQVARDLKALLPPKTIWLPSHPLNGSQEWQNRITEFHLAQRAGLSIPPTICTNDPRTAIDFIERCGGRALLREFSIQPYNGPIKLVTTKQLRTSLNRLRLAPCNFTKYIEKEYEIRAVVIGEKVLAVRINSQASPLEGARRDWRYYDNAHVRWERMTLPKEIERSMLKLMKTLDLKWGSFDLIKSRDGVFYFLEVNRPGNSSWLLPFVGLDVIAEIIRYLKRVL
jgi:hypothetical protein